MVPKPGVLDQTYKNAIYQQMLKYRKILKQKKYSKSNYGLHDDIIIKSSNTPIAKNPQHNRSKSIYSETNASRIRYKNKVPNKTHVSDQKSFSFYAKPVHHSLAIKSINIPKYMKQQQQKKASTSYFNIMVPQRPQTAKTAAFSKGLTNPERQFETENEKQYGRLKSYFEEKYQNNKKDQKSSRVSQNLITFHQNQAEKNRNNLRYSMRLSEGDSSVEGWKKEAEDESQLVIISNKKNFRKTDY